GLYPSIPQEKIHVVHVGVNPEVYENASAESERTKSRPQVLSVGAITPSRGFGFLIEACLMLKNAAIDVEATIVGDGVRRRFLQHWIEYLGLADDIHLPGPLPQHEVARLMGKTDVFVLPSVIANDGQMDGIPITLMEAMAAGKPVIASAMSGIPELVDDRVSGLLIDATHTQRIANAIKYLVANPAVRHKMGRAGQKRIHQEFDIRRTVASLIEFLDLREKSIAPAADRILSVNWEPLKPVAFGVRRVNERQDSCVAEVAIVDATNAKREVVVKQQRSHPSESRNATDRAQTEFDALTMLREAMGDELSETGRAVRYTVPRVLAFDKASATLILERAPGKSLESIIREGRKRGLRNPHFMALHRTGIWLGKMQSRTRSDGDGRHIVSALVILALRDLDLASVVDREVRAQRASIAERLRELESRVAARACALVGCHGDYWPGNIYVDDYRVDVIDFEGYREGLPYEDVAQFLVNLELYLAYPMMANMLRRLRAAFLDSYVAFGGKADEDALQLFTITNALQLLARVRHPTRGPLRVYWRRRVLRNVLRRSLG
ncbi:MAG TPA: glycosyltransferase, partial [Thermoanaerobaculia bacterium]